MFSEKLNYLMMVTSTTNTELAKKLNLNQSVISRFKLGKREPSKKSNYYNDMAEFFANKIYKLNLQYKFSTLVENDNEKEFANNLYKWLISETEYYATNTFFDATDNTSYFYGNRGKQDAVILFLENLKNRYNETLYLYSDESMDWLLDESFSKKWSELLIIFLKNGNKIKIIHSFSRDYSELINAILKWLPLYLSGNIEPYFIPKLRDSITKRTLFISNNNAVISNSVENNTDGMLNIYVSNTHAVSALKKEFSNYLKLAKPFINIQNISSFEQETVLSDYIFDTILINNFPIKVYIKGDNEFVIVQDNNNVLKITEFNLVKAFYEYYLYYKNKHS